VIDFLVCGWVLSFWRQTLTANKGLYITSSERHHHIQEFIKGSGNLGKKKKKATIWVCWRKNKDACFMEFSRFFLFCLFLGGKKFHLMHKQELAMF
jgi:hypothetical protein